MKFLGLHRVIVPTDRARQKPNSPEPKSRKTNCESGCESGPSSSVGAQAMDRDGLATSGTGLKSSELPKKAPRHRTFDCTLFFLSNVMFFHHNMTKSTANFIPWKPCPPLQKDQVVTLKLFCLQSLGR